MAGYVDKSGVTRIWRRIVAEKTKPSNFESDGAIDTLFDTYYNEQTSTIVFGNGCADFDPTTRVLTIEGAAIVKDGVGIIVIS